jgi:hypothetical protein
VCELCHASADAVHYGPFFLIEECDTCGIPILVLNRHRPHLTLAEEMHFFDILAEYFPDYEPRGIGMRSIPGHWHEHLVEVW